MDRRKQRMAERFARGLCPYCGNVRGGGVLRCERCATRHLELQRLRNKPKPRPINQALREIFERMSDIEYEPTEAELEAVIAYQMKRLPSWYHDDELAQAGHNRTEDELGMAAMRAVKRND